MPEKIAVAWIDPEYMNGLVGHQMAQQTADMQYHGCLGKIIRVSASQPNMARNNVVREFLESDDEWLWTVDADVIPDKGHPMKLWLAAQDYEADMVSGLNFLWKESQYVVPAYFYEDEPGQLTQVYNALPEHGQEIAACALGSVLIHRRVFEAMPPARTEEYHWFDVLPEAEMGVNDGTGMVGTDVQFFLRARRLGFKLIVATDAKTSHLEFMGIDENAWRRQWQHTWQEEEE